MFGSQGETAALLSIKPTTRGSDKKKKNQGISVTTDGGGLDLSLSLSLSFQIKENK